MLYSGTCPRCGATITTNIAPYNGMTWVMCQTCSFWGNLYVAPQSPYPAQLSSPSTPSANTAGASSANTPATLLEALRADAQLYGEEIADAVGRLTMQEARGLALAQVWDRMQVAQDALYRALGERRMGDYPPDIEQVTRALVEVGVWHIVALGVVERLNRPSTDDGEVAP